MNDTLKDKNQATNDHAKEKHWKDFKAELPTLIVHVVKNAGHRVWMDSPQRFNTLLGEALKR